MSVLGRIRRFVRGRIARGRRAFAAAQFNRVLAGWYGDLISANLELQCSLTAMRARSRQLCQDNPHAAGYLRSLKDNVAGPHGMQFAPRVFTDSGDLDTKVTRELKRGFKAWGKKGVCTTDKQLSWVALQRLIVATCARDGDFLAIHRRGFKNLFGYALQLIDADQLDESYNVEPNTPGGNRIVMGIEVDSDSAPVAFHFWDRHPSERYGRQRVRVPAKDVLHVYVVERPGQLRGIPWLAPAMVRLKMLDAYEDAHITAARVGVVKPWWVVETEAPAGSSPGDAKSEEKAEEKIQMELEPGMGGLIPFGYDVKFTDAKFPSNSFSEFAKSCLRSIASGIGIAYNTFANDLEGVNYSSMRGGSLNERDGYRALHVWLAESANEPIFAAWLPQAMAYRALRLPSQDPMDYLEAGQFYGRGWDWYDPEKDISAFEREYALKLNSLQRVARERGRDLEEVFAEIAQEQELASEWGLTIGPAATKAPNENTEEEATNASGTKPESQATDDDAEGDEARGRRVLQLRAHSRRALLGGAG